jgi:outer membrane protein assembly factor BamB
MFVRHGFGFVILIVCEAIAGGDDWPQWMGEKRDNTWRETGLIDEFPAGGPKVAWRSPIAGGYAGPAVANGRVFVADYFTKDHIRAENFERKNFTGIERLLCFDEATGQPLWKHEYPVEYTISYPAGPRCTPNVDGDRAYFLGAEGHLTCLQVGDGKLVWGLDLKAEFGAKVPLWGFAAHPLIDGDKLITLAGGAGAHAVALDKHTGKEIWRFGTSKEQGYSPPTIISAGGKRQLILLRPDAVTSLDPETGREYWSFPYEATSGSIIMSPVVVGEYLYAAGYSSKSLLLRLDAREPKATEVWRDMARSAISPVNVQPIADGNVIYGCDQKGPLAALEVPSGKRLWETMAALKGGRSQGTETAFLVRQADRYWLFNELGELIIAKLSPAGFEEIDRAKVIEPSNVAFGRDVVWSMPAFANRRAYIRNDKELICVDLAK